MLRESKKRKKWARREETEKLIERIVRSTVAAARKAEENAKEPDKTPTKQDTMAAGEPNKPVKMPTWRDNMECRRNGNQDRDERHNEHNATHGMRRIDGGMNGSTRRTT